MTPNRSGGAEQAATGELALPALLRLAHSSYGLAIREALQAVGFEDLPPNGAYVIGAVARTGAPLSRIVKSLGVSKQVAGQLVDTLVVRGYLDRAVDSSDRRRVTIALTARGREASGVVAATVTHLDQELRARVGPEHLAVTRVTLGAILEMAQDRAGEAQSLGPPKGASAPTSDGS